MEIVFYILAYCVGYIAWLGAMEFDEENSYLEYIGLFIFWPLLTLLYIGVILYFCINKWYLITWKKL